jgi:hypothetical protein
MSIRSCDDYELFQEMKLHWMFVKDIMAELTRRGYTPLSPDSEILPPLNRRTPPIRRCVGCGKIEESCDCEVHDFENK